jgi:hypothetical protein
LLGLQDGIAMLQAIRVQQVNHAATPRIPQAVPRMELGTRSGGE